MPLIAQAIIFAISLFVLLPLAFQLLTATGDELANGNIRRASVWIGKLAAILGAGSSGFVLYRWLWVMYDKHQPEAADELLTRPFSLVSFGTVVIGIAIIELATRLEARAVAPKESGGSKPPLG